MKALLPIYHTKVTTILAQVGILIIVTVFLASCGKKLSGTYNVDANGGIPFKKMNFTSDTKVELKRGTGFVIPSQTFPIPYVSTL